MFKRGVAKRSVRCGKLEAWEISEIIQFSANLEENTRQGFIQTSPSWTRRKLYRGVGGRKDGSIRHVS